MQNLVCPTCQNPLVFVIPDSENPRKVEFVNIFEYRDELRLDERFYETGAIIDVESLINDMLDVYLEEKGICRLGDCCRNTISIDDREALYDANTYVELAPPPSVESQKYGLDETEFG